MRSMSRWSLPTDRIKQALWGFLNLSTPVVTSGHHCHWQVLDWTKQRDVWIAGRGDEDRNRWWEGHPASSSLSHQGSVWRWTLDAMILWWCALLDALFLTFVSAGWSWVYTQHSIEGLQDRLRQTFTFNHRRLIDSMSRKVAYSMFF